MQALAGSSDMREVEARARSCDADAVLALEVYVHRLRASIAAMVTTLDGLDVLVFTGGIGEHSSPFAGAPPRDWASSASRSTMRSTRRPMATRTFRRLPHPCEQWS